MKKRIHVFLFVVLAGTGTFVKAQCPPSMPLIGGDTNYIFHGVGSTFNSGVTFNCNASPFYVWANEPAAINNPNNDVFTPCIRTDYNLYWTSERNRGTETFYEGGTNIGCVGPGVGCAFPIGGTVPPLSGLSVWDLYLSYLNPTLSHDFVFTKPAGNPWSGPPVITLQDCWSGATLPSVVATPITWTSAMTSFTCTVPANTPIGTASYTITPSGSGAIFDFQNGYVYVDPNFLAPGAYTLTYHFAGSQCAGATSTFNFTIANPYTANWTPPANLCSNGACVNLPPQVTGTAGGTWSGTGVAGTQFCPSTSGAGSFPVTYTVGTTAVCGATQTNNITVTAQPVVTANATPASICSGQSTTLNGGGATSYTWNPGGATTATITVSPGTSTTYTLIGANGVCQSNNTVLVSVTATPTVTANAAPTTICSGQSTTLSGGGAGSYTWSANAGGATTQTTTVSPTSNTTYTLTGANGVCFGTQTVAVNVTASPTVTANASSGTICSGQTTTLTAGGATNYTWMPGGATTQTISVNPASSTTYTLSGANGACPGTQTVAVTVNPLPTVAIAAGAGTICSGQSTVLTASGATNYTWSANAGSATTSTVSVSPGTNTTYTVTGDNGSCQNTQVVTINVNPTPTVTAVASSSTLCATQTTTLTASGAGSYTWMPGNLTGASITDTPGSSTVYTVTGSSGGCTSTGTVAVTVTPLPTVSINASPSSLCTGQSSTLTANGATSYTWSPNAGSATTQTVNVTPGVTTVYTVTGIQNGCVNTSTLSVSVGAAASLTITATQNTVCTGQSTTLTGSGATNYTWTPGNIFTSTVTVSPSSATTYTLAGDNGGCSGTQTITIGVNPTPTVSALAGNNSLCSGQSTTLTGSGATNYTWMPGGATTNTISVSPGTTSNYTLTGSSAGCTNTFVTTVSVTPTPTVTASAGTSTVCAGQASVLTGGGATTYTWMPGNANTSTVSVTPGANTTYTLTGANGNCVSTQTVNVMVNPSPTVSAVANNNSICSGQSATLTGSGAASYTWMPGGATTSTISVSPNSTTSYTLTGMSAGCTNTFVTMITVTPSPTVTAIASTGTLCSGQSSTLTGGGATNYTWSPGGATSATLSVTPLANTTYTLIGANGNCTNTTTVNVVVNPSPTFTNNGVPDSALCGKNTGGYHNIGVSGGSGTFDYQWYNGSTAIPGDTNLTLAGVGMGTYSLSVIDENGCPALNGPTTFTVPGSAAVVALFTPNPNTGQAPLNVSFNNGSTAGAGYSWNFGNGTASIVQNPPPATYTTVGVYTVTLLVNKAGCSGTFTATIIVEQPTTIIIPNVFSPNGDGINDDFFIYNTGLSTLNCDIYNRWGQKMYTISAPHQVWDGRTPGGEKASEGTYYYIVHALGFDGKTYDQQGSLLLVK